MRKNNYSEICYSLVISYFIVIMFIILNKMQKLYELKSQKILPLLQSLTRLFH